MNIDDDYALALQLQKQLDNRCDEYTCTTPVKSKRNYQRPNVNLASPSWELSDPTPNVHALFLQFNHQFFWGKLGTVVVRWSKRMYSCAGICRYEGRNGFCDIALSEPLLKLRPRSDLIETLLHEMIHAFLFITSNDRDRDGHGPNFHKHMNRINQEANLHISVYHNFIDEVRLYQTHWWRCNGPCQRQKPFFGMVRITCNRAPGPNDFWWSKHTAMCGGTFIKIKEPEKKKTVEKATSGTVLNKNYSKNVKDIREFFKTPNTKMSPAVNNMKKYDDQTAKSKPLTTTKPPTASGSKYSTPDLQNSRIINENQPYIEMIRNSENSDVKSAVRNHWSSKYPNTHKRLLDLDDNGTSPNKIIKIDYFSEKPSEVPCSSKLPLNNTDSIMHKNIISSDENSHLNKSEIISYGSYILSDDTINECNKILQELYGDSVRLNSSNIKYNASSKTDWESILEGKSSVKVPCPICNMEFSRKFINIHVNSCLQPHEFEDLNDDIIDLTDLPRSMSLPSTSELNSGYTSITSTPKSSTIIKSEFYTCPMCCKSISIDSSEEHLEDCLRDIFKESGDSFEEIEKSDDVINLSFEDEDDEDFDKLNSTGTKLPCPCCLFFYEEKDMNSHLDQCIL